MTVAEVHLLDVGTQSYGDCVLLRFDGDSPSWVLVDGGHRSDKVGIIQQLTQIFGHSSPFAIDLLIISHAHDDHIGALPDLLREGHLRMRHALLPDTEMAFGPADPALDGVATAVAVLRGEAPEDLDTPEQLDAFAIDAVTLRTRYDTMLADLAASETSIVLFGSSGREELRKLERAFSHIGFAILGPSRRALDRSAALLRQGTTSVVDSVASLQISGRDGAGIIAALDATQRLGHLVNAQSVVCTFAARTPSGIRTILLGGDFQFAALGTTDQAIARERDRLLRAIGRRAPYAFAKLSHHGSDNAVDVPFLDALGPTDVLGICCGRGHPAHPDRRTLELLSERAPSQWIRTDRSGHLTVRIEEQGVHIVPDGQTNNTELNVADAGAVVPQPAQAQPAPPPAVGTAAERTPAESVSFTYPPHTASITIKMDLAPAAVTAAGVSPVANDVQPASAATSPWVSATVRSASPLAEQFEIGAGRAMPRLLFLTDTQKLTEHLTPQAVALIVSAIGRGGHRLCDTNRLGPTATVGDILSLLRADVGATQKPAQIVILGGYDVVPSQAVQTIPPETPGAAIDILRDRDPDGFVVWSDDTYADLDANGLPEIPISRLPDARDAVFTLNALQAEPAADPARCGIRNSAREFVNTIFSELPGTANLLVSGPTVAATLASNQLVGSYLYWMLHGLDSDAKRFWGEQPRGTYVEAVTLDHVPVDGVDVVVLGCCWGALSASTKAADWSDGQPVTGRLVGQSIALSLLAAGARAVIGCTGAHYSPTQPPFDSASGPFHRSLWQSLLLGKTPAAALLAAKLDFATRLTGITDTNDLAIAYKTLTQFTCLGLGC